MRLRHIPRRAATALGSIALATTLLATALEPAHADPRGRDEPAAAVAAPDADRPAAPAVRLTPTEAGLVDVISTHRLRVPAQAPFAELAPGQALVVPRAGEPLILAIGAIRPDGGGQLVLDGSPMNLLELAGHVGADLTWNTDNLFEHADTSQGRSPADRRGHARDFDTGEHDIMELKVPVSVGKDVTALRGEITLGAKARLKFGVDGGIWPPRAEATAEATMTATLGFKGQVGAGFEGSKEIDLPIPQQKLPCSPLPLGLGTMCPTVEPKLVLSGAVSAGGQATFEASRTVGASLTVSGGVPKVDAIFRSGSDSEHGWEIYGNGELKAALIFDVQFHYLTWVGPYLGMEVGPFLKASADTSEDPWWKVELGSQIAFTVGGAAWLDITGDLPPVEFELKLPLFKADGPFPGIVTSPARTVVRRGETIDLEVDTTRHVGSADYVWTLEGGGKLSRTTGPKVTYEAPRTAGFHTIAVTSSEAKVPGSVLVEVLPDPPAAPANVSATPGLRNASVTFKVTDNGGAPIDQVEIRRRGEPDSQFTYAFGGPYRYVGLPAREAAQVQVRVHNHGGWSDWSRWSNKVTPYGPTAMGTPTRFRKNVWHQDLSADGRTVAYMSGETNGTSPGAVTVENLRTGRKQVASVTDSKTVEVSEDRYALDPTGRYLAFSAGNDVWVRDLKKKATRDWDAQCGDTVSDAIYRGPRDVHFAGGVLIYTCGSDEAADLYYATNGGRKHVKATYRAASYGTQASALSDDGRVLTWVDYQPEVDRDGDGYTFDDDLWDLVRRDMKSGRTTRYTLPNGDAPYPSDHEAFTLSGDGSTFAIAGPASLSSVVYTARFNKAGKVDAATFRAFRVDGMAGYDTNLALSADGRMLAHFDGSNGYARAARISFYDRRSEYMTTQKVCRYNESETYPDHGYVWGAHVQIRNNQVFYSCSANSDLTPVAGLYRARTRELAP